MTLALLLLAATTPDAAFDAYAKCASSAASSYKGPMDSLEAVAARIDELCAGERTTLLEIAPDKRQAAEWVRTTGIMAVSQHVPGLPSVGKAPQDERKAPAPVAASRYPRLDAYRSCVDDGAAKIMAEIPYAATQAIVAEAVADCEKPLKAAAEEAVAEMKQPGLLKQVVMDFRRRATADLTQKITAQRAGGRGAG
ncbi:hypothetical protein [Rhizorhabdus dicambivorans]|uniref:Uncharacterized protein n=1 Tax=Rhizorhabdus dicambivorans TaxID=1850238 RepID=A0A2A4FTI3_9SPHN|nr:hypothetical protein [Rhizorhabdus dicambivorans]ATE63485.1 hypothetical protein CMV14_02920 [Rhizorhabdus dicambivorans]PCE41459.1 hypothetical protein COO09_15465 [Rhizorhabdus dicambivorans]